MKIEDLKSKNGIRIILAQNENATSVTCSISAGVGSDMEDKNISGISHLVEHMIFKGTSKRPNPLQITQEFDNLGAYHNAYTTREYTTYFAKSRPENLTEIFDILSDMYQDALFEEKELEKEKGVVIEEIRMYKDQPDSLAGLISREIAYGDTPEGRSIAGSIETVSDATKDVLVNFRDKYYVASNTAIVFSGNFDKEKIISLVEDKLNNLNLGEIYSHDRIPEIDSKEIFRHHEKVTEQTHVVIGFPSFKIGTDKDPKLVVLKYILGGGLSSRLSVLLREELGASYYTYADNEALRNYGYFEIAAGIKTELLETSFKGIANILKDLRENLVPEDEFKRVIDSLSGKIAIAMETTDSVASYLTARAMAGIPLITPKERIEQIRKVTREDVLDLAKEIFKKENARVTLVGHGDLSRIASNFIDLL